MAYIGNQMGGVAMGAAGALLGTTIVEGISLLYMILLYFRRRSRFDAIPQLAPEQNASTKRIAEQLMVIAIPITIGSCIVLVAVHRLGDAGQPLRRLRSDA
mgnify:CR=1 FL=1